MLHYQWNIEGRRKKPSPPSTPLKIAKRALPRKPPNSMYAYITHNELTDFYILIYNVHAMSWLISHIYYMYFNIIPRLDTIPIPYHDVPGLHKAAGAALCRGSTLLYYYRAQFLRAAAHVVVSCEISFVCENKKKLLVENNNHKSVV